MAKQALYCVAYEYRVCWGVWKPDFLYMHADNVEHARLQFFQSEPNHARLHMNIVGISQVIGYFVDDEKGEQLSV